MTGARTREWGELERELLRLLRGQGELVSARQLQELFSGPVPAYTTLMTALTRLERKGQVLRIEQSPRKVRFSVPRPDGKDAGASMISTLDQAEDRKAALLAFAGNLDAQDIALLRSVFPDTGRPR
ncbi:MULTISPECIES: BlaI/MecI/CopY family transcriptional regulator [Micrococcales]|uniref:BlaI/MecI/CopY family transcriptional regulator n=1 Tax=Micrococcales TaxID=85006 RepID=UPI000566339F|nr:MULTISPECIES: BlaI/MecI/CopY family transcriptional regulator [Micrococcales]AMG82904.1 2'-5' RNA ligase [Microbacterium sp. PAMC 28756]RBO70810.1 2'-5' RNA ligase [Microbacterium sp. H6]